MFTPPPSPTPFRVAPPRRDSSPASEKSAFLTPGDYYPSVPLTSSSKSPEIDPISLSTEAKQRIARRTKWTILLVPAILLLITASTRYLSHPVAFDILSGELHDEAPSIVDWHLHKRHPQALPTSSASISFPTPTSTSTSSVPSTTASITDQDLPTIPQSPPVLPTPFPRPLTAINQNFSTLGCQNFFTNMSSSESFLDCRPVSLLIKTSGDFIQVSTLYQPFQFLPPFSLPPTSERGLWLCAGYPIRGYDRV